MTSKTCRAKVKIRFPKGKNSVLVSKSIFSALSPELKQSEPFARATLTLEGANLSYTIEARELADLRAGLNSHLRLIDASYRSIVEQRTL